MMKRRLTLIVLLALAAVMLTAAGAGAQGVLVPADDVAIMPRHPHPPIPPVPPPPRPWIGHQFEVVKQHVDVRVDDAFARVEIRQTFKNVTRSEIEAVYLFPIPENATISDFKMLVNGNPLVTHLMDKDEARRIYESYLRRRRDPGLLEYLGRDLFKCSVFPIPPGQEREIRITYTQQMKYDSGSYRFNYPLRRPGGHQQPIGSFVVNMELNTTTPLRNIYSPTHNVAVDKQGNYKAYVSFEESHYTPGGDFDVVIGVDESRVGVNMLQYVDEYGEGFFMLLAAPGFEAAGDPEPKDIVFVIDNSGSMSGEKIVQARDGLKFCVNALNPEDRITIINFNSTVNVFSDELFVPARQKRAGNVHSLQEVNNFIDTLNAGGGTDINSALAKALDILDDDDAVSGVTMIDHKKPGRPAYVIFLTDGQPTVGEQNIEKIAANARQFNRRDARVFCFGVGHDVNAHLLDKLSIDGGGLTTYVEPGENIEEKVSSFYSRIQSPVLTDLELKVSGVRTYDVYPRDIPDLFRGTQLSIVGKFSGKGNATFTLTGYAQGKKQTFTGKTWLGAREGGMEYLPKIWAGQRIGDMMDTIRLKGHNQELVDEIVKLSKQFGIITPYTSFLADENVRFDAMELHEEADAVMRRSAKMQVGAGAAGQSVESNRMKGMADKQAAAAPVMVYRDAETGESKKITNQRNVNNQVFFQQGEQWVDGRYTEDMPSIKIKPESEAYYQVFERNIELAKYFAVGNDAIVINRSQAIILAEDGKEKLTEKELKQFIDP